MASSYIPKRERNASQSGFLPYRYPHGSRRASEATSPAAPRVVRADQPTPSRKRVSLACSRCRKRKIKCSGESLVSPGPCDNCVNAGNDGCIYVRPAGAPEEKLQREIERIGRANGLTLHPETGRTLLHPETSPLSEELSIPQYSPADSTYSYDNRDCYSQSWPNSYAEHVPNVLQYSPYTPHMNQEPYPMVPPQHQYSEVKPPAYTSSPQEIPQFSYHVQRTVNSDVPNFPLNGMTTSFPRSRDPVPFTMPMLAPCVNKKHMLTNAPVPPSVPGYYYRNDGMPSATYPARTLHPSTEMCYPRMSSSYDTRAVYPPPPAPATLFSSRSASRSESIGNPPAGTPTSASGNDDTHNPYRIARPESPLGNYMYMDERSRWGYYNQSPEAYGYDEPKLRVDSPPPIAGPSSTMANSVPYQLPEEHVLPMPAPGNAYQPQLASGRTTPDLHQRPKPVLQGGDTA